MTSFQAREDNVDFGNSFTQHIFTDITSFQAKEGNVGFDNSFTKQRFRYDIFLSKAIH